jgi:hypothetical protein
MWEMNSDYFAIERSINGSDFTAISTVKEQEILNKRKIINSATTSH